MKRTKILALCLCACLLPGVIDASNQRIQSVDYLGFNPKTELNDLPMNIAYQYPDPRKFGPGPYPLFVWTVATYEWNRDALSLSFVTQMANRGFVAASVQYSN